MAAVAPLAAQAEEQADPTCREVIQKACKIFEEASDFTGYLLLPLPWGVCVEEIREARGDDLLDLVELVDGTVIACGFPATVRTELIHASYRSYFEAELAELGCSEGVKPVRDEWAARRFEQPRHGASVLLVKKCILEKQDWGLLESLLWDEDEGVRYMTLFLVPMNNPKLPEAIRTRVVELLYDPSESVRKVALGVMNGLHSGLSGWAGVIEQALQDTRLSVQQRRTIISIIRLRGCDLSAARGSRPRISCE